MIAKKLKLQDVLCCDEFNNIAFTGEMTEFDSILLPTSLVLTANKYAKDASTKIFHDKEFVAYIKGEELMQIMSRPTTLLMLAKQNLISKFIRKEANIDIFPLKPDVMTTLLQIETSNRRLVKFFTNDDVKKLKKKYEIPKSVQCWCEATEYDLDEAIDIAVENLKAESEEYKDGIWVPKVIDQGMNALEELLDNLDFEVYNGPAGSGKSHDVLVYLNKEKPFAKCMICTLSNTIGLMFKKSCARIQNFSITRARFVQPGFKGWSQFTNNEIVVVDEFSQWGIESIDVLIKLIKCNKKAKFFFMGDKNQIPTFISSGSLLVSMMQRWPDKVKNKTQLFRFQNNKQMMLDIINGDPINTNIQQYDPSLIKYIDCIITGTNEHVDRLNVDMINQKFDVDCAGCTLSETIKKCNNSVVDIICKTTGKIGETKVCSNERFKAKQINDSDFDIVSDISKEHIIVNEKILNAMFKLGYAITVNKAQGLEWRSTCVYMTQKDENLKNHNAIYVALSRSSTKLILFSEKEKDKKGRDIQDSSITIDDVNNILKINYKFQNLFTQKEQR